MDNRTDLYQELLENRAFVAWASGEALEQTAYWQTWADNDPERQHAFEQARQVVQTLAGKPVDLSDEQVNAKITQAIREAKRQEAFTRETRRTWWSSTYRWASVAAVFLLMVLGGYWYTRTQTKHTDQVAHQSPTPGMVEVTNLDAAARYVGLPDGSSAILKKNSRLSYPRQFAASRREVHLTGEAFFEVAKNPAQPFLVYAGELVTKVLGTSFSVKAFADKSTIDVVVKTGKVAVFSRTDKNAQQLTSDKQLAGLVLLPNQQVKFDRDEVTLSRSDVQTPTLLNIPIEKLTFEYDATPVSTVFDNLEKAYGVHIVYNEELMANCSITATLGDEPLANKLKWICTILEASYEINKNQISVTGKPCQ